MYTQCSKCETVFKLSAETLRAASGQVRCGRCGEVFNALARLAEEPNVFVTGESPLDLEARADSILESKVAPQVARTMAKDYEEYAPPGIEIAQLEVLDWTDPEHPEQIQGAATDEAAADDAAAEDAEEDDAGAAGPAADRSLEFTLPPGELDRIFIDAKKRPPPRGPQQTQATPQPKSPSKPVPPPVPPPVSPPVPPSASPPASSPASPPPSRPPQPVIEFDLEAEQEAELPAHPESAVAPVATPIPDRRRRVSGLEISEDARREMLEGIEQKREQEQEEVQDRELHLDLEEFGPAGVLQDSLRIDASSRGFKMWLSAGIAAALLLMVQIVHENRGWFVTHAHGPFGAVVRAVYGAMGTPLPAPANLSSYQLRQWGVTGEPDANSTLRVRASILNTAAQLQPFPLLRVTLADRFGKSIGTRDFEPSEYVGKPIARLLAPGERVDATLKILDPGKNAEGFEIDVCLRGADQRISCANDVATQPKR